MLRATVILRSFERNKAAGAVEPAPIIPTLARKSFRASMRINPGVARVLCTSCETTARNFSPLGFGVEDEEEEDLLLLPQEINARLVRIMTARRSRHLFKQATPKSMMNNDLDAKLRIIAERLQVPSWSVSQPFFRLETQLHSQSLRCKTHSHLVFSKRYGFGLPFPVK